MVLIALATLGGVAGSSERWLYFQVIVDRDTGEE